ncbi:hypothetical protein B0T26DRAFT_275687 [Lasiosphaeria miniovina]|uniref:Uncharacterized protein n=1 Tax=Lasiosphaeria miniovina TaxID=1954250 RepID=A0AA40AJJ6_9PEZI|nr:uncharacterized protein B0T26DRAFT_275687 [Lasiosphaeria miniovina]KAK0717017.1 hypothetical protein B0T26DRAFT_275687 [Lasiosphaeria miniovina]
MAPAAVAMAPGITISLGATVSKGRECHECRLYLWGRFQQKLHFSSRKALKIIGHETVCLNNRVPSQNLQAYFNFSRIGKRTESWEKKLPTSNSNSFFLPNHQPSESYLRPPRLAHHIANFAGTKLSLCLLCLWHKYLGLSFRILGISLNCVLVRLATAALARRYFCFVVLVASAPLRFQHRRFDLRLLLVASALIAQTSVFFREHCCLRT